MTNPTSNFGWVMPTATSLVTNLPADFNTFGQAVDNSMADLLGGTTNQVLKKTSATDMDFTWATNNGFNNASTSQVGCVQLTDSTSTTSSVLAATATAVKTVNDIAMQPVRGLAYRSGVYYTPPIMSSTSNLTYSANTTYYLPFFVRQTYTFTRIAFNTGSTSVTGTGLVRLGIYNNNSSTDQPSTVLLDAGTVSVTANNTQYTITISQQLNPGVYWLALNTITTPTTGNLLGFANSYKYYPYDLGISSLSSSASTNFGLTETQNVTSGFATSSSTSAITTTVPVLGLRA
jgi:hypothetical protein